MDEHAEAAVAPPIEALGASRLGARQPGLGGDAVLIVEQHALIPHIL